MQNNIIGVDIGGTSISAGRFINKKRTNYCQEETGAMRSVDEILSSLIRVIDNVKTENTSAIGVGVPGYIDKKTGEIKLINNIPAFQGLKLKHFVEKHYNIPVFVDNDANCFALGIYHFDNHDKCENIIGLTLGTGLGGGIVINGKLHSGIYGGAGEFGGIPYLDMNFENYCGSKFFDLKYQTSGKDLFSAANAGEKKALSIFNEFGEHLGNLILHIMYSYSPEKVVIGGSIAKAADFFIDNLRKTIDKFPLDIIKEKFMVETATLQFPEIHGAAALCYAGNRI